jgi:hypothetical protein
MNLSWPHTGKGIWLLLKLHESKTGAYFIQINMMKAWYGMDMAILGSGTVLAGYQQWCVVQLNGLEWRTTGPGTK